LYKTLHIFGKKLHNSHIYADWELFPKREGAFAEGIAKRLCWSFCLLSINCEPVHEVRNCLPAFLLV